MSQFNLWSWRRNQDIWLKLTTWGTLQILRSVTNIYGHNRCGKDVRSTGFFTYQLWKWSRAKRSSCGMLSLLFQLPSTLQTQPRTIQLLEVRGKRVYYYFITWLF